ncbi:MAG: peptidase M16 [Pirellulaceae bacterium]|nr:MAG: peptidase M16 [Pirellulaceae bacterium]
MAHRTFAVCGLVATWWFLGVGFVSAELTESVPIPRFPIEYYRLENGLKVGLLPDPQLPRVTVVVAYHVGSKNERRGLTGFAHFFEHMMFRGTRHVPNFDAPLQEAGGEANAFTTEDVTVYFETVPPAYLKRVLYMEAERMAFLPAALDQEKFDTEREVVKNERRQRMENVPYGLADETIQAHLFAKGHPYSWSVIGSMKDLDNATLDDLRRFFYEFYHPANAALIVVGNFDVEQTKQWIDYYFAPIPAGPEPVRPDVPAQSGSQERLVQYDRVELPRVYWAWRTCPERSPDAPALDLLADVLADGVASRLYQSLVVPQLAVDVEAVSRTGELDGSFLIAATAAPDTSVRQIESVLEEQLAQILAGGVQEDELQRAVAKHRVRVLRRLADPQVRAFAIAGGAVQYNDPHDYQRYVRDYLTVDVTTVKEVAARYLGKKPLVLVVEPVAPGQPETPAALVDPLPGPERPIAARSMPEDPRWDALPEPQPDRPYRLPVIEQTTLSNGIQVWVVRREGVPLVALRLLVHTGTADDPPGQEGLVSLIARVWPHGTRRLSAEAFTRQLESYGVTLTTVAQSHVTQLGCTVSTQHLSEVVASLAELVRGPRLDADDVQRERDRQLSELRQGKNDPGWVAGRVFPMVLYGPEQRLGRPALGREQSLARLDAPRLESFYHDRFRPERLSIVLVGDVRLADARPLLEQTLGAWQVAGGDRQNRSQDDGLPTESPNAPPLVAVDVPGAVQSVLVMGRRWLKPGDPQMLPAHVANRILGGDFLSRLNQNLREQHGYTYGVRAGFRSLGSTTHWVISTSVRADVTAEALREIFRELEAVIGDRPLTDAECQTAKRAEQWAFPEKFESLEQLAEATAQLVADGLPADHWQKLVAQLDGLSMEEVRAAAARLAAMEGRTVLVVGDRRRIEEALHSAGWADIQWWDADGNSLGSAASVPQPR